MDVQDAIDSFEKIHFRFNKKRAATEAAQAIEKTDQIEESDLKINLQDKKLMRREARKQKEWYLI